MIRGDAKRLQLTQTLVPPKRRAGVTAVTAADISMTGVPDWVVAREDGSVEFWAVSDGFGRADSEPVIIYETALNEAVRSVGTGNITSGDYPSLVVCTYSGKVVSLSADPASADATGSKLAMVEDAPDQSRGASTKQKLMNIWAKPKTDDKQALEEKQTKEKRFAALKKEVDELKGKLQKEKQKYESTSVSSIAVAAPCKVNYSFKLLSNESCYVLSFECQHNLDIIAIRGDVQVDLLDHGTTGGCLQPDPGRDEPAPGELPVPGAAVAARDPPAYGGGQGRVAVVLRGARDRPEDGDVGEARHQAALLAREGAEPAVGGDRAADERAPPERDVHDGGHERVARAVRPGGAQAPRRASGASALLPQLLHEL